MLRRRRARDDGSAALAAFVLVLACGALTSVAIAAALESAREHRAHGDALCARFAGLAGTELGPSFDGRPDVIGGEVTALTIVAQRDALGRCYVTAAATCGSAVRTAVRHDAEPSICGP
jgi:hypothetical protein